MEMTLQPHRLHILKIIAVAAMFAFLLSAVSGEYLHWFVAFLVVITATIFLSHEVFFCEIDSRSNVVGHVLIFYPQEERQTIEYLMTVFRKYKEAENLPLEDSGSDIST